MTKLQPISFSDFFQSIPEAVIAIDRKGTIISANPGAVSLFGYDKPSLLGKNVSLLMPAAYQREHGKYLQNYLDSGESKIIGSARVLPAKKSDGTLFSVYTTITESKSEDGEPVFIGMLRDLSDMERNKQLLETIFESAPSHILLLDDKYAIKHINRLHESETRKQLVGKNMLDLVDMPENNPSAEKLGEVKYFKKSKTWEAAVRMGEQTLWFNITASPIISSTGITGFVVIATDTTELKNLSREVFLNSRLSILGEVASGIVEEFNSHLSVISDSLREIEDHQSKKMHNVDRYVNQANDALKKIEAFSKGLVDGAEGTQQDLNTAVDLVPTLDAISKIAANYLSKDNISVTISPNAMELGQVHVKVSASALHHIISTLISLARHSIMRMRKQLPEAQTGNQPSSIKIHAGFSGDTLQVCVEDNGAGYSDSERQILVNPLASPLEEFSDDKQDRSLPFINLNSSLQLAETLQAQITLAPLPQRGFQSMLCFPAAKYMRSPSTSKNLLSDQTNPLASFRYLVVDDEPFIRELLVDKLIDLGANNVDEAANGEEALACMEKAGNYDIILSDLTMPKMGGKQLIKEIADRNLSPKPSILIITGGSPFSGKHSDEKQLMEHVDGYIFKPFTESQIEQALQEILEKRLAR